ncbi:MAG TPA: hypothetical protein VL325_02625 [Pyrinomonadaceae bacterium]|nr:hypothetical protein [Pyrinomonadaceae bacterium]
MKNQYFLRALLIATFVVAGLTAVHAQSPQLLKRTTTKTDKFDFSSGGTVAIVGAPAGSITVEGWKNSQVEISAEIEVQAESEADLAKIAQVTTFVLQESLGRTGIISTGTHDKKFLKSVDKKFPKQLIGLPFRIDYHVKVPHYTDLDIDGGTGDLNISGVEGMMKINYLKTNAKLDLVGGGISATFGTGDIEIVVPNRSWRGRLADVQLASGTMTVHLPPNLNAEIDAVILRTGKVENVFTDYKPRDRHEQFTDKSVIAKAGNGGIPLKFTVGDGTLKLSELDKPQ